MNAPAVKERLKEVSKQAAPVVPAPKPMFRAADVRLREFNNNVWRAIAPRGLTHQDLERPEVWAGIGDLKAFDEIHVVSSDRTWWAELLVVDALPGFSVMKILRALDLPPPMQSANPGLPPGFEIRPADIDDERGGWIVERLADHAILGAGLRDYEEARRHLMDHASLRRDRDPSYLP